MAYSYSNLPPNQNDFETLYADSETYLVNETLPDNAMGSSDRKQWVQSHIADSTVHTQIIKDDKVICWFAGKESDGFANYTVALVSPDLNGSRSFWYSADFWGAFEAALQNSGLVGWMCDTLEGTSLHSTLSALVDGKSDITQKSFVVSPFNIVRIKFQF